MTTIILDVHCEEDYFLQKLEEIKKNITKVNYNENKSFFALELTFTNEKERLYLLANLEELGYCEGTIEEIDELHITIEDWIN